MLEQREFPIIPRIQGGATIRVCEGADVTITGSGTLTAIGNNGYEYSTVSGYPGNTTDASYKDTGGSGIGLAYSKDGSKKTGTIRIADLSGLYAYGFGMYSYGIGGDGGKVIISKSTVYVARGGFDCISFLADPYFGKNEVESGPGIGGESIVITGSTIDKVYGGSKAAGIGSRFWLGVEITIANSELKDIVGGNSAAGIGNSHPLRSTTTPTVVKIVIENSTIKATGGYYGAGIGSGYDSNCGNNGWTDLTIIISSYSEIEAHGGTYGACIGTGYHSAVLKGSVDNTVVCTVSEGTVPKSGSTYSHTSQGIGYGVVDSSREAKSLLDAEGNPVTVPFTVGGVPITNPFDPDRLAEVNEKYP